MSFSLTHSTSTGSLPDAGQQDPKDFYVNILPNEVTIINLNTLKRIELLQPILELTMMSPKVSKSQTHFFSLTSTDDELSLVTDKELLLALKRDGKLTDIDDYNTTNKTYHVLQFHEGMSGISHTGIVEYLSRLFSAQGIAIIYINTYNNNFILIDASEFEKCRIILKKYNYV